MADREIVYKVDRQYKRIHLVLEEPEATAEGGSCDLPFLALDSSLLAGTQSEWRMGVELVDSEAGPRVEGPSFGWRGSLSITLGRREGVWVGNTEAKVQWAGLVDMEAMGTMSLVGLLKGLGRKGPS